MIRPTTKKNFDKNSNEKISRNNVKVNTVDYFSLIMVKICQNLPSYYDDRINNVK